MAKPDSATGGRIALMNSGPLSLQRLDRLRHGKDPAGDIAV